MQTKLTLEGITMGLSKNERQMRILETKDFAAALFEDLAYIRRVISSDNITPDEVRRMSSQLRRILIDNGGDLGKVAAPRIGRYELIVPDIRPLIRSGMSKPFGFLSAGVADVYGMSVDCWMAEEGTRARNVPDYSPGSTVSVSIDGFLSQKVICFQGEWVSRKDVIKYIANIASGVHSGRPQEASHMLLRKIRYAAYISIQQDPNHNVEIPNLVFNPNAFGAIDRPIETKRSVIDFVLVQLLSAAKYLCSSPDLIRLEAVIDNELAE